MPEKRSLFNVYVVDPRNAGKLLKRIDGVIAIDEAQAQLKAGVGQIAADAQLELEQVDIFCELVGTFIRARKETQKVKIATSDEE